MCRRFRQLEIGFFEGCSQVSCLSLPDDLPLPNNQELGGDLLRDGQDVGGKKDGNAAFGGRDQDVTHRFGGNGVNGFKRFIEEQGFRVGQEGHGKGSLLAGAVRAATGKGPPCGSEPEGMDQLLDAVGGDRFRETIDVSSEKKVFVNGKVFEESQIFR